ncbi:HD domain-containing protein [Candidatus Micrarchaeota archaeon]|nr:HD domain-containing protein [Candidatus Micrarchaeota archaeon]
MEEIARYIFEAGMLKRVARSGWWAEKIKHPESAADHSFRTAIVAFIIARMEGFDEDHARKICTAAVFHDMHETRLLDLNKITHRYIEAGKELELRVEKEQAEELPAGIKESVLQVLELSQEERQVLKDADYVECAFQAKEYLDTGHAGTANWIRNIKERVSTESAKKLVEQAEKQDSNSWWKGLKKLD